MGGLGGLTHAGGQPAVGDELPLRWKALDLAELGDDHRSEHLGDAGDLLQPLDALVMLARLAQLRVALGDVVTEHVDDHQEDVQHRRAHHGQLQALDPLAAGFAELVFDRALAAVPAQYCADLVLEAGSGFDQALAAAGEFAQLRDLSGSQVGLGHRAPAQKVGEEVGVFGIGFGAALGDQAQLARMGQARGNAQLIEYGFDEVGVGGGLHDRFHWLIEVEQEAGEAEGIVVELALGHGRSVLIEDHAKGSLAVHVESYVIHGLRLLGDAWLDTNWYSPSDRATHFHVINGAAGWRRMSSAVLQGGLLWAAGR